MSKVTMEEFASQFANELNIDVHMLLTNNLQDISEYDSMGKINVSLLIEDTFNFQIEFDDLNTAESLKDLYEKCVKET